MDDDFRKKLDEFNKSILEAASIPDENTAERTRNVQGKWPIIGVALAVKPSEVKKAEDQARKLGVPTEFTNEGKPVFTSQSHMDRYARARGYRCLDSYTQ